MIERDIFTGEYILDKTEKLTQGKYAGRSLATIEIIDKQYLLWFVTTNGKYSLSDTWRQYLEDLVYKNQHSTYCTYMKR